MSDKTLTQTLAERGYAHRKARNCGTTSAHDIFEASGKKVFTGRADETWEWLKALPSSTGRLDYAFQHKERMREKFDALRATRESSTDGAVK